MHAADHFAPNYAEARGMFLAAADAAGLARQAHRHPLLGRDGELLAMDVARFGPAGAARLLLISSACHGAEGFCGSGVQHALLTDPSFHSQAAEAGVAVLYVHALNPYGFSWLRRVTHENVDLNRNFHDFSRPLPENPAYDALAHLILPATWPAAPDVTDAVDAWIAAQGQRAWQKAVSSGQHSHPQGLFYGGRNPTWSQQTLRHVLQDHGVRCTRLAWLDLHTGLGPSGHAEPIHAGPDGDAAALARARAWWGEVTSTHDGSSTSAPLTGLMWNAAHQECPQAEHTGLALEYGTLPLIDVLNSLRAEHWLENHPEADAALATAIKRQCRDAFYVDTDEWKRRVVEQGLTAARQAVAGLASA